MNVESGSNGVRVQPLGDQSFQIVWDQPGPGSLIDPATRARAMAEWLLRQRPPGVRDAVPGPSTVVVWFEPLEVDADQVQSWLRAAVTADVAMPAGEPRQIDVPVLYQPDDPQISPDLNALASQRRMSVDELIARHTAPTYRCVMLGFRPGFPYLEGLDPLLATPRLSTPRAQVPAGSVGIGGPQTGVYPVVSPGGWHLIGRTPARLFDPERGDPFLVHAGDTVRFAAVDRREFDRLASAR